jgi:SulP family sulfate permease
MFYGVTALSGIPVEALRANSWLTELSHEASDDKVTFFTLLGNFSWGLLLHNFSFLATILLTSAVSILLTASALELAAQHDIDLNRELQSAGAGTLLAGLAGGMVGFHSLSMSRLALSMGARSRWVGIISAICCGLVFWVGPSVVSFVPLFVCGGLLFFLSAIFLFEWIYEARLKLTGLDYMVVLLILSVVGTVGYPEGVAVGIVAAVVLFVHNYSRVEVVSQTMSGAHLRSSVERPVRDIRYLREQGEQICVLRLQGFIFFGTANHLLNQVRTRAMDTKRVSLRYVVLDFRRVTGIDSSAAFSLWKVHEQARKNGFTLVLTHMAADVRKQLSNSGLHHDSTESFRLFPDLDHGMEWCESMILASWD